MTAMTTMHSNTISQRVMKPLEVDVFTAAREQWTELRQQFATILQQKTREKTLELLVEKASQLDLQAFSVARAILGLHLKQIIEGIQDGSLSLADRERLLRMCDTAHRLGRRALGKGETSD